MHATFFLLGAHVTEEARLVGDLASATATGSSGTAVLVEASSTGDSIPAAMGSKDHPALRRPS